MLPLNQGQKKKEKEFNETISKGQYSLYTIPGKNEWKLILTLILPPGPLTLTGKRIMQWCPYRLMNQNTFYCN